MSPFYDLAVTSSPAANLRWRIALREAALHDVELQAVLRQACFDDVLFFLAFAGWLVEPRAAIKVIPFIPWEHQEGAIQIIVKAIQEATIEKPIDVIFDKSRGQGATWIFLWVFVWFWLREPMFAAGIISRNIEAVDKKNYKGSLFPKIDWMLPMLPQWMLPAGFNPTHDRSRTDHVWHNPELDGTISGTACTAEAFSGERLSAAAYDEAAKVPQLEFQECMNSISHVTNVRLVVSTHYGDSGPFYDMIFGATWTAVGEVKPLGGSGVYINAAGSYKVILDWKDNPTQSRLAYRVVSGQAFPLRAEEAGDVQRYFSRLKTNGNWAKLNRKGFVKEGQIRSPWYDRKCLAEDATPAGVAQDIGRDPRGTVGKLFNTEVLDEMDKTQTRPPVWEGEAIVRDGKLHLMASEGGPLKLWFKPGLDGSAPEGNYVVSADPGSGIESGDSGNSTICGGNASTGEQVLEFSRQLSESRLADLAVALAEWLDDALLIWEAQGTYGKRFAIRVLSEICYGNVWKRPSVSLTANPRLQGGTRSTACRTTFRGTRSTCSRIFGLPCRKGVLSPDRPK